MLTAKNINKRIADLQILSDVSISLEPGKITALIGPSGGGKSTLLSCLSRLSDPTSGRLEVDGDIYDFSNGFCSRSAFPYPTVTVVFQGLFLWPHLRNVENICLPLRERGLPTEHVRELADRLSIGPVLDKYPHECSGGEKQRVALARQILLRPKYLLLDEVTSALDLETMNTVAQILSDLKANGTSLLLVTHMINLAKTIADDFHFLDKGFVVEAGPIGQLNNPQSKRLHKFLQIYS